MNFDEYQDRARATAIYPGQDGWYAFDDVTPVNYCILGINGEAGELAEKLKKSYRDDGIITEERRDAMLDEAGDVLWYISQLAVELGSSLEEVAANNLKKLASRYERGAISGDGDNR